ncbi:N-acetyltransferase [Hujiaoplasma nucleasis]|uniref:N-acetyltransferase n=1 Tax=Hujiaoplasma nucleasis TaxID=2725268 RepID=A0A7L6N1C3_9MOLU|nr:GNAT family N-acetyltransferase [Hujiaoplasma nucleasis]QLY40056.1 N-acetyltransferase [Hujiaoplasma nucleasis]
MDYLYDDNRIYSVDDNMILLAEVLFPARDQSRVDITHVFVVPELRGQGVASELMLRAYQFIKSQDLKIVAKCPYAISWFKKHPDYQDIVINVKTKV